MEFYNSKYGASNPYQMTTGIYYAYEARETKRGDNLLKYTPVFQFEITDVFNKEIGDKKCMMIKEIEILDTFGKKLTSDQMYRVTSYLKNQHALSLLIFKNKDDAKKHHDKTLKNFFHNFTPKNVEKHTHRLYSKSVSKIQEQSLAFYGKLSKTEKTYIKWLSKNKTF